ncbi:murein biosynthesis integral membrane protein MurJ [Virgisporangium aurantiacum]|uniref:Peptidoglycan lipid II flippase n=1 Tax=Virgisporangium aurantiacum TaxID=175570 RepID=A0A8J3ZE99_9ACTN|nr:murein biosynthesis integral membrane protein MurJ [Virgisporangium aurantiacum]GIJ59678.1 hypothetical protein Vau01_071940 [Virgisporangium aurantiacum]
MSRPGDPDETVAVPAGDEPERTVVVPVGPPAGDFDQTVVMPASPLTAVDAPPPVPLVAMAPDDTIVMSAIPDGPPHPQVQTHRPRHAAPPTAVGAAPVPPPPARPPLPPHVPTAATGHASVPEHSLNAEPTAYLDASGRPRNYPPQAGHMPQAGYPPQASHAPQAGYPPQASHAPQAGYAPSYPTQAVVGTARVPEAPAVPPTTDGTTGPDSTVTPPVAPPAVATATAAATGAIATGATATGAAATTATATAPARASAPATESRSVARNSAVMAAGSVVSRLTGFLRAAAISAALGAGLVADDYQLAITLPNMVFELLVGGVLSSVIVPVLVRTRKADPDGGQAYAQRLMTLAVIALGVATTLAVLAAPLFTTLLTPSKVTSDDKELVTHLAYLILPAIFCYGMAALMGALLNSRGHFAAPMWTPILNNVVVIGTAVLFIVVTSGDVVAPDTISTAQILVLGLGTMSGIIVQAAGLLPALHKVGFRWKPRFDFRSLGLGELGRLASWMLLYVVVNQIGLFVVLRIAKDVGTQGEAGVIVFQNAFLIFMMAHGIVAVSVLTALMPRLSAAAADGRHQDLIDQLNNGLRLVSVVLVPITAAYIVLGRPMAVTLFEWGNYKHENALATAPVIAAAGLGLVPYAIMQLQQFAFYALRDTRTPSLINIPVVGFRIVTNLIVAVVLPTVAVTAAMMGGSALSFTLGAAISIHLLRRRLGFLGLRRVASALVKLVGAAAVAAVPTILLVYGLSSVSGTGKVASIVQLLLGSALLFGLYYVLALVFRVAEVRDLTRMVRGRLGRSG